MSERAMPSNRSVADPQALRDEDQRARQLALHEFRLPVVLIAGAGTGKTTALVRRLVTWAMGEGWTRHEQHDAERTAGEVLQRVVCITFTDKAALEMATRIHEVLSAIAEGKSQDWLTAPQDASVRIARARALIAAEGRLRVSTIHGFCQGLLKSHAMTAGLKPCFSVDADGDGRRLMAEEVLAEIMPQLLDARSAALKTLLEDGHGVENILATLRELVHAGVRSEDLEAMDLDVAQARRHAAKLALLAAEVHESASEGATESGRTRYRRALVEWLHAHGTGRDSFGSDVPAEIAAARTCDFSDIAKHPDKKLPEHLRLNSAGTCALARQVSEGAKDLLLFDPVLLGAAREVLLQLLRGLEERLRLRGVVSFDDLLRGTRDLLVAHPELAAELAAGMDQLMVDEVQDTDPCQYAIVQALAFGAGARPSLFIIGDPKQCIYTFRNADLAALDAFLALLRELGAVEARLSVNYRSNAVVLEEVSALMAPAMVAAVGEQPPFEPLLAARETPVKRAPGSKAIEVWDASPVKPPVDEEFGPRGGKKKPAKQPAGPGLRVLRQREAAAVAEDILAQNLAGTPWHECLVLLRVRSDQNILLEAMRERGIPVQGENEKNWHRRREVVDAANALIAVLDHKDDVALLGWLRSPMVGLPDVAVAAFWNTECRKQLSAGTLKAAGDNSATETENLIKNALADADTSAHEAGIEAQSFTASVAQAIRDLLMLRWHFAHADQETFFGEFRKRTGCLATESRRMLGELRLMGVTDLLEGVQAELAEGRSPMRVVEDLRARLRADIEVDTALPVDPQVDAVRVMTVHKAKGLEADQVWFCDVSRRKHTAKLGLDRSTCVHKTPERNGRAKSSAFEMFDARSLGVAEAKAATERREELEVVRLLYVAATRARHRLVVSGAFEKLAEAEGPSESLQLLRVLAPRHAAGCVQAQGAFAAGADTWLQESSTPVLWRHVAEKQPSTRAPKEGKAHLSIQVASLLPPAILAASSKPLTSAISNLHKQGPAADPDADEVDLVAESSPKVAAQRGTLLHKALELWDAANAPVAEAARLSDVLQLDVLSSEDRVLNDARREAQAALQKFAVSPLCKKFATIAPRIRAREFPLLAPGGGHASGALIGTIDMLYEEVDGTLVIVDYKTDVCTGEELVERHRTQLMTYVRALTEFFKTRAVRAELWSLHMDKVVTL